MPILGGTTTPEDKRALHKKIRGPTKEDVVKEVRDSLNLTGPARYVESTTSRIEAVQTPCLVFVIVGAFEVSQERCDKKYEGYTITEEQEIKLDAYAAFVIIQLS